MKPSKYNTIIASPHTKDTCLLYNTLYDHQLLITEENFKLSDLFSKLEKNHALNQDEYDVAIELKDLGIVIDDHVDEYEQFEKWFDTRIKETNDTISATIFTTNYCNLACPYCFEKGLTNKSHMDEHVQSQVNRWLIRRIIMQEPKNVHLEFFGGEPLMNMAAIKKIGEAIKNICTWKNINYTVGITTNGVLLTPDIVDQLCDIGLTRVKVTLDGYQEEHDKRRCYANGKGSFQKIIKNLEDSAGRFKIIVGGNFDKKNLTAFPVLIEQLKNTSFRDSIQQVQFKPIVENYGNKYKHSTNHDCDISSFSEEQIAYMFYLTDLIRKSDLPNNPQVAIGPCEFYRRNFVSIDVNGDIYKCLAFVGRQDFMAGNVYHYEFTEKGEQMLDISPWREQKKCLTCPYLPICAGGCRATAWNDTGSIHDPSCDRLFLEQNIEHIIAEPLFSDP